MYHSYVPLCTIHMYPYVPFICTLMFICTLSPYFLFAAIHHLKSSPTFSVRPCSSVGRVTVDVIRRSWVRFPPRSKDFFFASCGSLIPFTRVHGFIGSTLIYTSELILCSTICVLSATWHNNSYVPLLPVLACVEDGQFLCNRNSAAGVCDTDYSALELLQSPSQLK